VLPNRPVNHNVLLLHQLKRTGRLSHSKHEARAVREEPRDRLELSHPGHEFRRSRFQMKNIDSDAPVRK